MALSALLTDDCAWRGATQDFTPLGDIINGQEIRKVLAQLVVRFIMKTHDHCLSDRTTVHPFKLTIHSEMS